MFAHCWKPIRWTLVSVCLLALGAAVAQTPPLTAPPAGPLTVDAAVTFALCNNPAILRAVQDVAIAEAQLTAARGGRYPTVTLNDVTTYTPAPTKIELNGRSVALGNILSNTATLSAAVPVYPTTRWEAPISIARATVELSQSTLQRTRQQTVFQTRQAFFGLLSARELLRVADQSMTVAQQQLRQATITVAAGIAAPLDRFQAEAALANAEVNRVKAANAVDVAQATLATQLGLSAGTPVEISEPAGLPAAPASADALIAQALKTRPELVQLTYRRRQIQGNIELIRIQQLPVISLQANYNQSVIGGSALGASGFSLNAAIGLTLYNGGTTRAQLSANRLQLEQVDTIARQLELGVTLDIRQAWLNLRNAVEQLRAADRQLVAAQEALRIAAIRYQNGEGILLEEQQAQLQYTQALTSQAQARFQAFLAAAQLDFALGTPAPDVPCPPATPARPTAAK